MSKVLSEDLESENTKNKDEDLMSVTIKYSAILKRTVFAFTSDGNDKRKPVEKTSRRIHNYVKYERDSLLLPVSFIVSNDKKMSYSTIYRFHENFDCQRIDNEFLIHQMGYRSILEEFRRNVEVDFIRKYNMLMEIQSIKNEKNCELEGKNLLLFLVHLDPKSHLTITCKSIPTKGVRGVKKKIIETKCLHFFQNSMYSRSLSLLQNLPNDLHTRVLQSIVRYHINPSKTYSESCKKLLGQIIRKTNVEKGFQEPYRISFKNQKKKRKKKHQQQNLRHDAFAEIETNSSIDDLRKKVFKKKQGTTIGEIFTPPAYFVEYMSRMLSSSLYQNDISKAFSYAIKGNLYNWKIQQTPHEEYIFRSRYFTSVLLQLKEAEKKKKKKQPGKRKKYVDPLWNNEFRTIGKIVENIPESYNLEGVFKKSSWYMKSSEDRIADVFDALKKGFEKKKKGEAPDIHYQEDLLLSNPSTVIIPFLIEVACIRLFRKEYDEAFRIIDELTFKVLDTTKNSENFDYKHITPLERMIDGTDPNPYLVGKREQMRVYQIIVDSILKQNMELFSKYLEREHPKRFGEKISIFSNLLRARGEFEYSLKYIDIAKKSDRNNLSYICLNFFVLMDMGEYEDALKEAKWIFLVAKKNNQVKFIDCDSILNILSSSSSLLSTTTTKQQHIFYRIPSIVQNELWVIVGEEKTGDGLDFVDICQCRESFLRKVSVKVFRNQKTKPYFRRFPFIPHQPSIEKILYTLPLIAFLRKDYATLEKWIVFLSDLEFSKKSYQYASHQHHMYQVIANIYFLNTLKKKNNEIKMGLEKSVEKDQILRDFIDESVMESDSNNEENHEDDNTKFTKKIYVIGGGEILSWSHEMIESSETNFELVPVYCDGLKCIDLREGFSERKNRIFTSLMISLMKIPKDSTIILMVGDLDLRTRILNTKPNIGDRLHNFFSEDYQIEVMGDLVIQFACDVCIGQFKFRKVLICPVFPILNIIERRRVYLEKSEHGMALCGNRYRMVNSRLETKCEEVKKKNKKRLFDGLGFLEGLDKAVLGRKTKVVDCCLGSGDYVNGGNKEVLENLQSCLDRILKE